MDFTEKQKRALRTDKKENLLVSAAAGSGKTTVMVERIKKLILENKVPIDRFLVVTFTKDAASGMKAKLTTAIREEIAKGGPDAPFLREQLTNMSRAQISTFDSFAQDVDKTFFYLIDLDPMVKAIDPIQTELLKQEAMNACFADFLDAKDADFLAFLDDYSTGNQWGLDTIKDNLISAYDKLRNIPDYMEWLKECAEELNVTAEELKNSRLLAEAGRELRSLLKQSLEGFQTVTAMLESAGIMSLAEKSAADEEGVEKILESTDTVSLIDGINGFKAKTFKAAKDEQDLWNEWKDSVNPVRNEAKEIISDINKKYYGNFDIGTAAEDMRATYPRALTFLAIMEKYEEHFRELKAAKKGIDFADMEHYAIEILSHEEAAEVYRQRFDYIFIDEYQDSNYLQEAIIDRIKRDDNVFMVGDVKQSIYGFRNAEPSIFMDKYRRFGDSAEILSESVDLNENFRSKKPVIHAVNTIFEQLIDGYDDAAALHQGLKSENDKEHTVYLDVIDVASDDLEDVDEELKDQKAYEWEAHHICEIIDEVLKEEISEGETTRPIQKKDIVILARDNNLCGIYKEVLTRAGYDAFVEENSGYFDTIEIAVFTDLLRVIDNYHRDVPLLSVLRSFLFHFSIDDLIRIRLDCKKGPYYEAFRAYGENGEDEDLKDQVRRTLADLAEWRRRAGYMPIDEFLWYLIDKTGYYAFIGTLPAGEQRQANLRAIIDKAAVFRENGGEGSLYAFLRYVEALKKKDKVQVGQTSVMGENDDVIRIKTIHKSKGLEYPVVILAGLGKELKLSGDSGKWMLDLDIGIGLQAVDRATYSYRETLPMKVMKQRAARKAREEEVRVLYVACTRAKDVLRMTGTAKGTPAKNTFLRWLLPIFEEKEDDLLVPRCFTLGNLASRAASAAAPVSRGVSVKAESADPDLVLKVDEILSYRYPYQEDLAAKSKYSVSELAGHGVKPPKIRYPALAREILEEDKNDEPDEIPRDDPDRGFHKDLLWGAALGTVLHSVMEHMDFREAMKAKEEAGDDREKVKEYLNGFLDGLEASEILMPIERASVDTELFERFLETDLAKRMTDSPALYKETPFVNTVEMDGRDILVQGIIDCYFEEGDELVLIDYKSNLSKENIKEIYDTQIKLYKKALEDLTGKKVKESYLYLIRYGELVDMS